MSSQNQPNMESQADTTPEQMKTTVSRRKFILGAASASVPVIAAVHSGSAWSCVNLQCSPGQQSLSTGGSAVASAVQSKANTSYLTNKPKWSTLDVIEDVIVMDFFKYLYNDFNSQTTYYWKSGTTSYSVISRTSLLGFVNKAKGTCYVDSKTSTGRIIKAEVNRKANYSSLRTNTLLIPASFNGIFINSKTTFAQLGFSGVNTALSAITANTQVPYKYILAAFIGAVWERHPEYALEFPGSVKCYPEPQDILNRFNNASAIEKKGLENLFEFYTTGKVQGKVVG